MASTTLKKRRKKKVMKIVRRRAVPPDRIAIKGDVLLSLDAAQRELRIAPTRIYLLVREGTLKSEEVERFPRRLYVTLSTLRAYKVRRDAWLSLHGRLSPSVAVS